MIKCKICESKAEKFQVGRILDKYSVQYYRCSACGAVQTEEPYWLDEAYSAAITDADIGIISRNNELASRVCAILKMCLRNKTKTHLDYGGGYGIFVRLMRDAGFDFEWYDKYCENLFAKGFEKSLGHYDVVTGFELLEHLPSPLEDLGKMISMGDSVICSTELLPDPIPSLSDWWYYALRNGQHITFYTSASMRYIADYFNCMYYNCGNIHVFSKHNISKIALKFANRFPAIVNRNIRRKSLLPHDYEMITGIRLQ